MGDLCIKGGIINCYNGIGLFANHAPLAAPQSPSPNAPKTQGKSAVAMRAAPLTAALIMWTAKRIMNPHERMIEMREKIIAKLWEMVILCKERGTTDAGGKGCLNCPIDNQCDKLGMPIFWGSTIEIEAMADNLLAPLTALGIEV